VKHIILTLEKNAIIGRSTPASPSREPNPHRSRPPIDTPRWHCRKEEDPHLHTKDIQQEQSLSDYAQQDLSVMARKQGN
jgi:hypothetical protein